MHFPRFDKSYHQLEAQRDLSIAIVCGSRSLKSGAFTKTNNTQRWMAFPRGQCEMFTRLPHRQPALHTLHKYSQAQTLATCIDQQKPLIHTLHCFIWPLHHVFAMDMTNTLLGLICQWAIQKCDVLTHLQTARPAHVWPKQDPDQALAPRLTPGMLGLLIKRPY